MSDEEIRELERRAEVDPAARRALWIARARTGDFSLPTTASLFLVTRLGLEEGPCQHRTMHESPTYRCTACRRSGPNTADALHSLADVLRNAIRGEDVAHSMHRADRLCFFAVPDPEEDALTIGVGRAAGETTATRTRGRPSRSATAGPWEEVETYFPDFGAMGPIFVETPQRTLNLIWARREIPDRVRLPRSLARDVCVEVFRLSTLGTSSVSAETSGDHRTEDYRRLRDRLNEGEVRLPDGRALAAEIRALSLSTSEATRAIEEFGRATGPFVCRGCGHLIHVSGRCAEGYRSLPRVPCGCTVGGVPASPVQNFGPFCECGHGRLRHRRDDVAHECLVGTSSDPRIEADRITGRTPSAAELPRCPCLEFRGTAETQERQLTFSPEETPTPRGETCGSCGQEITGDHAWLDSRTRMPIARGRLLVASGSVFCCSGHAPRPDGDEPHHG